MLVQVVLPTIRVVEAIMGDDDKASNTAVATSLGLLEHKGSIIYTNYTKSLHQE